MAYPRSTLEPPHYFQSNSHLPTNTRVGSSGFSYFVPVESQAAPPYSNTAEKVGTVSSVVDSHQNYRSSSGNLKKHKAINSTPTMSHNTVSNSGDWAPAAPVTRPRNPSAPPPSNKLHPSVPLFGTKRPKMAATLVSSDDSQKAILEPNFYNGYMRSKSVSMPAYNSAGNSLGHRKTDYLTKNANPVPGGYRGSSEMPRSPKGNSSNNALKQSDGINASDAAAIQVPNKTFEEYQNESKKNAQKLPPKKRPFNLEELPVNQFPCLVVLSVSIETMNRLLGRTPKTDVLFEFYGILDSPVNYLPALKAKKFTLRQGRSYINCIYFETDKVLSKVVRNHFMRCVGKWNLKLKAVVAYSARHAKQEEARKSAIRIEQHEEELAKYFS